jgi:hypothetical protein
VLQGRAIKSQASPVVEGVMVKGKKEYDVRFRPDRGKLFL